MYDKEIKNNTLGGNEKWLFLDMAYDSPFLERYYFSVYPHING